MLAAADPGGRHLPRLLDQAVPQLRRQRASARAACSTASRPGSPSPRRPPGPGSAGSAASTRSSPTASTSTPPPTGLKTPGEELKILFVGRPEERKGLPILLTAFNALVEHVPSRLTVIGAEEEDVKRWLADPELLRSIDVRGRVSEEELWAELHAADVLCAPSLSGRELRHGPDRGLRRRHPGDRLRDRRLQRRRHRRRRRPAGPARRPAAPRRGAAARRTTSRSGSPRWAPPPATAPNATPGRGSPTR